MCITPEGFTAAQTQPDNWISPYRLRRSFYQLSPKAPTVFDGRREQTLRQLLYTFKALISTDSPGPIVDETTTFLRYNPLEVLGFALRKSTNNLTKFSTK